MYLEGSEKQNWNEKNARLRSRPRKDHRGFGLIFDALPFGSLWYGEPDAIRYAKFFSRSQGTVIRVFDEAGNVR